MLASHNVQEKNRPLLILIAKWRLEYVINTKYVNYSVNYILLSCVWLANNVNNCEVHLFIAYFGSITEKEYIWNKKFNSILFVKRQYNPLSLSVQL